MAAISHGTRHLRQGIGVSRRPVPAPGHTPRSIHIPAFTRPNPPSPFTAQRILAETRTFLYRLVSHLTTPGLFHSPVAVAPQPSLVRLSQFSNSQGIGARFSLPVKHALSRPFSPPRLPRPPAVPANFTHVGLGTARAFHSSRPIFQNMVDNVPIATRTLWEAEWDIKMKMKKERRARRTMQSKALPKSREMLKPKPKPVISEPQSDPSELDVYFPVESLPAITTHLLVPLAPTPTARLPLSNRTDIGGGAHPLLPISNLVSIHTTHRLHSLRVSTLFAKLDTANVWDDPGVNVDAYAFGPRRVNDAQEKQCTVLRVTFRGWNIGRVRAILNDPAEGWYSLEETLPDGPPSSVPLLDPSQDVHVDTHSELPSLESAEAGSSYVSEAEMDDGCDVMSPLPIRASASAQHDLVLPTLDFSSAFSDATANLAPPPQPVVFLHTVSELTRDAELALSPSCFSSANYPPLEGSWQYLGSRSSFLQGQGE